MEYSEDDRISNEARILDKLLSRLGSNRSVLEIPFEYRNSESMILFCLDEIQTLETKMLLQILEYADPDFKDSRCNSFRKTILQDIKTGFKTMDIARAIGRKFFQLKDMKEF